MTKYIYRIAPHHTLDDGLHNANVTARFVTIPYAVVRYQKAIRNDS